MNQVTIGKIIDLSGKTPPAIPQEFLDALITQKEEYAIFIFAASQGIMRVIPTDTSHVIKLIIHINELGDDFIDKTVEILSGCKSKLLYSSGVCFAGESDCYYECYIEDPEELRKKDSSVVSLEKVVERLSKISGVTDIVKEQI